MIELLDGVSTQVETGRWAYQIIITAGTVTVEMAMGQTGTPADVIGLVDLAASTNGEIAIPTGAYLTATISDTATIELARIERP